MHITTNYNGSVLIIKGTPMEIWKSPLKSLFTNIQKQ